MTGTVSHLESDSPAWCLPAVVGSALLGLALIAGQAYRLSATYDEVTYLKVAAHWWRTGEQAEISRMGSPLTFWKLQQAPTLWALDHLGRGEWVDDPERHQAELLPVARIGASWTWLAALVAVAAWARRLHGPRAMAMASAVFALGPNLLAHGSLLTMEMPLVAATSALWLAFWSFLRSGSRWAFWASAGLAGLAFSCKFTTILMPPILALTWGINLWLHRRPGEGLAGIAGTVVPGMAGFAALMVAANLLVTGFATIPLSPRDGDHPSLTGKLPPALAGLAARSIERSYPQDWVGFATQIVHQRSGGASYLLGERRLDGWRHYYLVCLAVKVPLGFWSLAMARAWDVTLGRGRRGDREWMVPVVVVAFLLAAMLGSKRNYGIRYLLPIAAPAIVAASALAEGGRRSRALAMVGLAAMAAAVAAIHPHELSYFNELGGGPIGGRRVLSDSNLDWGQGARSLAKLQRDRPGFQDLTLFYFGDTDPAHYGVLGHRFVFDANRAPAGLPSSLAVDSKFLAVSASLQWGPWGPEGYFRSLDRVEPVAFTDDATIAIYRAKSCR